MQHKGQIVEHAVRSRGYSLGKLAQQLKRSRPWVYRAFENPNLSIDYILAIGKIIQHDFYPEIKELKGKPNEPQDFDENDAAYWKDKYHELLKLHYLALKKIEELSAEKPGKQA